MLQIHKYGGSSLDTCDKRLAIGQRVANAPLANIIIVVSALTGVTDRLLEEISAIPGAPRHIIDAYISTGETLSAALLAASINVAGHPAEVVPATLIFSCNGAFGDGDLIDVNPAPVVACLERGVVPVVPGFNGAAPDGRVCVLGRGGSDYSAVALAAKLKAEVTLFKADTDSIYSADPNTDAQAERYARLTHREALALATGGAKVLNHKAALVALKHKLTIVVRSTFGSSPGAVISSASEDLVPPCTPSTAMAPAPQLHLPGSTGLSTTGYKSPSTPCPDKL